ncbi:MAG TPA: sigma-70 family RNA polymerase sigma factor [Candidatus Acidoferrales bacterium]|nr:sigma-70 family RNA polymerase sigma factor [Candidatus Acidoferrales bacterium]
MVSIVQAGAQVLRLPHPWEQTNSAVRDRQDEFEQVALPHSASLLRVAFRLTADSAAAEDLVQETFLLAWRSFHQFQRGTNARAWLFRILFNAFYGHGRKLRGVPPLVSLDAPDADAQPAGSAALPLADLAEVSQALGRLSAEHRTVLLLGVVEGFTCRDISGILRVPIGTVMSRLSRARQALRTQLAPVVTKSRAAATSAACCAQKEAS